MKFKISRIIVITLFMVNSILAQDKPNILWLVSEDNNTGWIGCYGNELANTPNIDKLAAEGFQYMNVFANAPVCAPQRSTWITGINALSMGTHPMRSRNNIPHDLISYYPDELQKSGYFCGNYRKTDYNIGGRTDEDCWNDLETPNWENLKKMQPFFQVINTARSHESRAKTDHDNVRHNPVNLKLHAYHPDLPEIRTNYARYYDCIEDMDTFIGEQLAALEASGMAENTIVIYNSDHGGVLPRSKRFLFDTGTHSPLIIRIPKKFKHLWPASKTGSQIDRLISFIDMPKTWISIAQGTPPEIMQGTIFLGPDTEPEQDYHFSFRGRMDERHDNQRAVRNKEFLYIRNYMPFAPWGQKIEYLWEMKAAEVWDNYAKAGKTNAITGRFFQEKVTDELYDVVNDPDNINNLINDPKYAQTVQEMKNKLMDWQEKIYDSGLMPETDVIKRAEENNLTIFELVRNPKLYNLKGYLKISNMALERDIKNQPSLLEAIKNSDSGIRYWGVVGCLLLSDRTSEFKDEITPLLNDTSHEIATIAAYTLYKTGSQKKGLSNLSNMLESRSYASLQILNILDWIGDDVKPIIPIISNIVSDETYIQRMQRNILLKYNLKIPESAKKFK